MPVAPGPRNPGQFWESLAHEQLKDRARLEPSKAKKIRGVMRKGGELNASELIQGESLFFQCPRKSQ